VLLITRVNISCFTNIVFSILKTQNIYVRPVVDDRFVTFVSGSL
jgi:hypothetical protein